MNKLIFDLSSLIISKPDSGLQAIYDFIDEQFCAKTEECLSEKNMLYEFMQTESFKNEQDKLQVVLKKHIDDHKTIDDIIFDYTPELIKAGTKGVLKGNKFNKLIKDKILEMGLDPSKFLVEFERTPTELKISERPDWYIKDLVNNKFLVGMNQLSFDGGGHQLNRASKYIDHVGENYKLISVLCHKPVIKTNKNKLYNIFKTGMEKK